MIRDAGQLVACVRKVFGERMPPKRLHVLLAAADVVGGADVRETAKKYGTSPGYLTKAVETGDWFEAVAGSQLPGLSSEGEDVARRSLGQLLIGSLAERAFEEIYEEALSTTEFVLDDERKSRSDTDYRVRNGSGRPVFRVNIKFHGSVFRNAAELVGLEPENCFALATYKIHQALQKQEEEHLSYVFLIVGVPGLTGRAVGDAIAEDLVHLCAIATETKVASVRAVEDAIVAHVMQGAGELSEFFQQIRSAPWYALSARRAINLMRDLLFERVFALRVRNFARNYRNAELDMHFALSSDLTPLRDFLAVLREAGVQGLTSRLERGTF